MVSIITRLMHWKIHWFGDRRLEKNGEVMLHCLKCDKLFKSYYHYSGGGTYDNMCKKCCNN